MKQGSARGRRRGWTARESRLTLSVASAGSAAAHGAAALAGARVAQPRYDDDGGWWVEQIDAALDHAR
ncbi:MAG: hypothetical protein H0W01_00855 [Pseudonocardiales bacterium]|nr:hypothetical protein [Pseudonocardiales bacterium]